MKGAKIKLESYRPVFLFSVVSKFARRLKGSPRPSPSSWFYGRAFLPTRETLLDSFPQGALNRALFDQAGSYLHLF